MVVRMQVDDHVELLDFLERYVDNTNVVLYTVFRFNLLQIEALVISTRE